MVHRGEALQVRARHAHACFCGKARRSPGLLVDVHDKKGRKVTQRNLLPCAGAVARLAFEAGYIGFLQRQGDGGFGVGDRLHTQEGLRFRLCVHVSAMLAVQVALHLERR
jgi:hypothetical protein